MAETVEGAVQVKSVVNEIVFICSTKLSEAYTNRSFYIQTLHKSVLRIKFGTLFQYVKYSQSNHERIDSN